VTDLILIPPIAFVIYILLVTALARIGRMLAGPGNASAAKSSTYSSGEAGPTTTAVPGYRPFFLIALFFAILHLSVLVLASGGFTMITGIYLAGIILALVMLILG
jgi:NADH:ubiquinone oxidoreductase subunit 3 (subunit A)